MSGVAEVNLKLGPAQKASTEMLLKDYPRWKLLDGCIVRLRTIVVRRGQPRGVVFSFCSGTIRERLKGEKYAVPVDRYLES